MSSHIKEIFWCFYVFRGQVLLSPLTRSLLVVSYTRASRLVYRTLQEFSLTSFLYYIEMIDERIWIRRVP